MLYKELKPETITYIQDCAKAILARMSVCANVHLSSYNSLGVEYVKLESEPFNTTPSMFKKVWVVGHGQIKGETMRDGYFNLVFTLGYRYEYYDGGENGANIGHIDFRIINDDNKQSVIFNCFTTSLYMQQKALPFL